MIKDIIIAIDGHSGCGKSTTSKLVAEHFKYNYLDSGAMYRSVALYLLRKNINYLEIEKIREEINNIKIEFKYVDGCLLYTSPSPRDKRQSRMPSSA